MVLDTGSSFSKPGGAFDFPSKDWLNGNIFGNAYRKFWLSESGDLYLINIEIDKKTDNSYMAHFGLTKVHSAEEFTTNTSSLAAQQQKALTVDLAVFATDETLRYSVLNTHINAEPIIKDFTENYLVWLLNGVGGKPQ